MISIKNLTKKYGDNTVYENFNLDFEEGETLCILGGSGSGKTTLLNCMAGLCPFDGEITPVRCSYVFQEPRLVPNLTVYGNLKLVYGDDGKIDEILKRVGIFEKRDSYPNKLSGGQAQRVSIARAYLFGGDIILMDEPFSSLDLKIKYEMYKLLGEMKREYNKTAVFVTHDVDEAVNLADKIIVIDGGRIKAALDGKTEKLRDRLIAILTENE